MGFDAGWRGGTSVLPVVAVIAFHCGLLLLGFAAAERKPRLCQWPPLTVLLLYVAMLVTLTPLALWVGSPPSFPAWPIGCVCRRSTWARLCPR
jgi:hypothetical protein